MATIGFIGLGNMGAPMAANLVKSGHHISGFDVVPASREASAKDGVQIVGNARATVEAADVVAHKSVARKPEIDQLRHREAHVVPRA